MYNLTTKIQFIKGIGPVKAAILSRLKIHTVLDLLEHKPQGYIYPGVTAIADLEPNTNALIHGTVDKIQSLVRYGTIVSTTISDDTGTTEAVWYNHAWLLNQIKPGMKIAVWGKVGFGRATRYQFSGPKFSTFIGATKDVAGGLYGGHSQIIREALKETLINTEIPEWSI